MDKPEYDLTIGKVIALHICSECNGTEEITGHKYWCSKVKKKQTKPRKGK